MLEYSILRVSKTGTITSVRPRTHVRCKAVPLTELSVDRTKSSRMGWSDVTLSMRGPIVNSLIAHFGDRWYVLCQVDAPEKGVSWRIMIVLVLTIPLGTSSSMRSTLSRIRASTSASMLATEVAVTTIKCSTASEGLFIEEWGEPRMRMNATRTGRVNISALTRVLVATLPSSSAEGKPNVTI